MYMNWILIELDTYVYIYFKSMFPCRYVLLHHVMGELEGVKGAWGYVEGGMGSVSAAIARCAQDHGAHVFCDKVGNR